MATSPVKKAEPHSMATMPAIAPEVQAITEGSWGTGCREEVP